MKKPCQSIILIFITLIFSLSACGAPPAVVTESPAAPASTPTPEKAPSIPAEVTGEVVYIPFPAAIKVDGDLSEWAEIPTVYVDRGPALSPDPAENGSFTYSVAADADYLYVTMQMPDKNIVAGKHGAEFWNEDSMEFYINASGDLNAASYGMKIMQVNINASDIGNTDPGALTITGVFSSDADVSGFVFKTADGWGFEAALSLKDLVEVTHGKEIGFQAQINGATTLDRDVKLDLVQSGYHRSILGASQPVRTRSLFMNWAVRTSRSRAR